MADTTARIKLALEGASTVEKGLAAVEARVGSVGKAMLGLAGGASLAGFAAFVKTSIDAADEMSKISQKAGIAVESVAGLQLAFQQSGLQAGDLSASLGKLNRSIADGSLAFDTMGISVRNTDGTLKTSRQVLGEVADRFAQYEDGAAKARLAQELFGKSGSELIPLLNGGSAALEEFDQMARQLGLTMDKDTAAQAERFNDTLDLLGMGLQGVGRQIAAQLLPTLSGLAGQFLESMTQGGRLQKVSEALALSLRALYAAGVIAVEVFTTAALAIKTAGQQIWAFVTGNFSEAGRVAAEFEQYLATAWPKTLADVQAAFTATGSAAVDSMAATQAAIQRAAPDLAKAEEAAKAATKSAEEFAKLRDRLNGQQSGTDSDFIKNLRLLADEGQRAGLSMAEVVRLQELYIQQQPYMVQALKQAQEASAAIAKARTDEAASIEATLREQQAAYAAELAGVNERIRALTDEQDAATLATRNNITLAEAVERVALARLREKQSRFIEGSEGYEAIEREIEAREKLIGLVSAKAARDMAEQEWRKASDQINQSLTDSLFRAFESGKGFAQTLRESIKNMFKTMVLRPVIQFVVGGLTGALGLSGTAMAGQLGGLGQLLGGSGGNSVGMLSNLANLFQGGVNFLRGGFIDGKVAGMWQQASNFMAGSGNATVSGMGQWMNANPQVAGYLGMAGNAVAGYGLQKGISGEFKIGNGKLVDLATLIGSALPGFGPWVGAVAGLVNRAFGMGARRVTGEGLTGTFNADSGANVSSYSTWHQRGGWFRRSRSGINYAAISQELDEFLDGAILLTSEATREHARVLGLNAESIRGYTKSINISLMGLDQAGREKAISDAIAGFGEDLARTVLGSAGAALQRDGESAASALNRLVTSLSSVNEVLKGLGQTRLAGSLAGADGAQQLLDLFGGLDAYSQSAAQYMQAFYTDAEKLALAQMRMSEAMGALGLSVPANAAAFRALVEAQDLSSDEGRRTYVALLRLAPAFAEIDQALSGLGLAMNETASAAVLATQSIAEEIQRLRGIVTDSVGGANAYAALQAEFATTTAAARAGDQKAIDRLPLLSQALESAAAVQAVTGADVARVRGQIAASLEATMEALKQGAPQLDVGTNYVPQDMLAMVHRGEAIVPRAYNPAAGGSAPSSAALQVQFERMNAELEGLRAEMRSVAAASAQTARILQRVTPNGTALNTVAETA